MKNLCVDSANYDIYALNRQLCLTEDLGDWLSSKIEARLKTFQGEWFANQTIGVPYFQEILKKQVDIDYVQAILSNVIKSTYGVEELLEFTVDYDNSSRTYSYTFSVLADSTVITGGSTL